MRKNVVLTVEAARGLLGVKKVRANGTWGKYNARICADEDGNIYHSHTERDAIVELKVLEKAGIIKNLRTQVSYTFAKINLPRRSYVADAVFDVVATFSMDSCKGPVTFQANRDYVIDIKSPATAKNPVWSLKKDLMRVVNGIDVIEVVRKYPSASKRKTTTKRTTRRRKA